MIGKVRVAIIAGFIFCFLFASFALFKPIGLSDSVLVEVKKGASDKGVFKNLENEGVISNASLVYIPFRILRMLFADLQIKSGEYEIVDGDSLFFVLKKLVQGKSFDRRYTVVEGQTVYGVARMLREDENLSGEIKKIPAEGYILPETYFFKKGSDRQEQLDLMEKKMEEALQAAWDSREDGLPIKNKQEMLILASIVEKETGLRSERDRVAGVFVNRLRMGMKLQSDPTVIYAVTKGKYKLERPLSKRDLRKASPFSTYYKYGLPETPIACPGREALMAVAKPMKTKDLYFVSDGNGSHSFATNLVDHNKNVRKLRKIERERKDAK